jgi:hypothetical protein
LEYFQNYISNKNSAEKRKALPDTTPKKKENPIKAKSISVSAFACFKKTYLADKGW